MFVDSMIFPKAVFPKTVFPKTAHRTAHIPRVRLASLMLAVSCLVTVAACGSSATVTAAAAAPSSNAAALGDDIVATDELIAALEAGGLVTMASAIEQLGDVPLLPSGDFTILAPTDDAFLSMSSDETADVLSDPELLLRTLQNHIVETPLTEVDLREMSTVVAASGATLTVAVEDGVLTVGGVALAPGPLTFDRGLIYPIDVVLVP